MNRNTLGMRGAAVLAAMLPLAAAVAAPAGGREEGVAVAASSIEGVWDSRVTLVSCADPTLALASFRALNQFNRHQSLIATSEVARPPSFGEWKWLGGRRYRATFRFQRFGVGGGAFEGLTEVTREIRLAANGNSFTGVVSTRIFDLTDTQIATGCGREEATRIY